jgi:hypothetical protein
VDRLREQLVALAVECPYMESDPSGCPLHEVRKPEPAAIIDWLDKLNSEEKDFLTQYHQCCLMTVWERDCVEGRRKRTRMAGARVGPQKGRKRRGGHAPLNHDL